MVRADRFFRLGVISLLWMIGGGFVAVLKLLAEREEHHIEDPRFEGDKIIYRSYIYASPKCNQHQERTWGSVNWTLQAREACVNNGRSCVNI